MSQKDKLIQKLIHCPKDFTFDEAETLLGMLSFQRNNKGKTSGSRVMFESVFFAPIIMHKPHPQKELKSYQIKFLIDRLRRDKLI